MRRSVVAIVVGFVVIGVLSFGTDALVRSAWASAFDASGRTENLVVLLLTIAYVGAFAVAGCHLTACLAPDRPMRHALILGALGLIFNVAGTVAMWGTAPAWYHVVSLLLVMPYAWLGGRLRERQLASRGPVRSVVSAA